MDLVFSPSHSMRYVLRRLKPVPPCKLNFFATRRRERKIKKRTKIENADAIQNGETNFYGSWNMKFIKKIWLNYSSEKGTQPPVLQRALVSLFFIVNVLGAPYNLHLIHLKLRTTQCCCRRFMWPKQWQTHTKCTIQSALLACVCVCGGGSECKIGPMSKKLMCYRILSRCSHCHWLVRSLRPKAWESAMSIILSLPS